MRILVATPTYEGFVKAGMHDATANLERGDHDVRFKTVKGYACDRARIFMANAVLDGGYDWALFVDSDVVPPAGALLHLLENDVDVCLGYYARHGGTPGKVGETCLVRDEGKPNHDSTYTASELAELRDSGRHLLEVKAGGLGCALIRADVFGRIEKPWVRFVTYADGSCLSEDYWFCKQLRKAGIKVHADARVACGHYARNLVRV